MYDIAEHLLFGRAERPARTKVATQVHFLHNINELMIKLNYLMVLPNSNPNTPDPSSVIVLSDADTARLAASLIQLMILSCAFLYLSPLSPSDMGQFGNISHGHAVMHRSTPAVDLPRVPQHILDI